MDSSNKQEDTQETAGNDPEKQKGENTKSRTEIDLFDGHDFEEPGREEVDAGAPSQATPDRATDEYEVSDSQVDIFNESGKVESKEKDIPDGGTERRTGSHKASDSQMGSLAGDMPGTTTEERHGPGKTSDTSPGVGSKNEKEQGAGSQPDLGRPSIEGGNPKTRSKLLLFLGVAAVLFVGISYVYIKYNKLDINSEELGSVPERNVFPITKEETITFDSFIVTFKENERFTYISLSIVIRLPNKETRREISRKRDHIRGILYDMFTDEINRANRIPPMDHLKKSIIRTVNGALKVGVVKEVFVTQFLAV